MRRTCLLLAIVVFAAALSGMSAPAPAPLSVTVSEGTSMSVAVSPDGRTLAIDMQGSIWTLPATGGAATRVTDLFNDARQPTWSPDGRWITFFGYRDGGYDIWAVAPDGSNQHKLTWGPFDDREPVWSHDGTRVAFSSDRGDPLGSDYNIWVLDTRSGALQRLTKDPADDYMPTWSPDDKEIAFASTRGTGQSLWAVNVATGAERKVLDAAGRVDAPSWGPAGQIVYHVTGGTTRPAEASRYEIDGKPLTGSENVFAFRAAFVGTSGSGAASTDFYYVSDGKIRKATHLATQPQGATWSPDGKRIAFFNVDGMWRVAQMSVLDVTTGTVTKVHDTLAQPGTPTWSPDGKRLALAEVAPYTRRFREGTNQVLTIAADPVAREGGAESPALRTDGDRWYAPVPNLSIDSRGGCGPVWSPDGTKMAAIYEGVLAVWPVSASGEPLGPPRHITTESAHAPSWAGDSRHILYQSFDKLRIVDIETGDRRTVPLDLKYTPAIPTGHVVVHAGKLLDMKSAAERANVDIVIDGNKITSVAPHADSNHAGGQVVDASNLTVMPGLVEFHSHLQKDFGESQGRAFLSFGVTTVRSPGNTPYEYVEDREANEAGVRPGPRVYGTGYLTEWGRVYYKMGIAVSTVGQLEMELQRAKTLQYDLIKSYVRLPDLQQKRMVEFAHSIGIPVATHEIYPAAFVGVDNTEHTAATSRRGYSPKMATLQRAYDDVVQLFGKSRRIFCPMISGGGTRKIFEDEPSLKSDPRFKLYPEWIQQQVQNEGTPGGGRGGRGGAGGPGGPGGNDPTGPGKMVLDIMRAGGLVVTGTDTPNAINLHGEITAYTLAGMSNFDAIKAATVNPAQALGLDAGTIEAGKLADLIMVDGDPLANVENLHKVKRVIANGRVYEASQLLNAASAAKTTAGGAR
ncbi:MAG: PD40 domain-containing protein [Acidobacteria bacterium]|nr:PD40 domain-containing protein [Acidobacteriota bacterium]